MPMPRCPAEEDPVRPSGSSELYRPSGWPRVMCSSVLRCIKYGVRIRSEVLRQAQVTHQGLRSHGATRIFPEDELGELWGSLSALTLAFLSPLF